MGDRQGGRRHGHVRPRRLQPGHRARRREDGLGPDGGHHRSGADPGRGQRRVPGGRHHRHHDAGHEAQHARHGSGRGRRGHPRGVPHRADGPARTGPRRPAEGRAGQRDDVEVAGRREPAGLQAHDEGQRPPDRRGREAHHEGEAPGALRRRRRDQGRRVEGAVQAGDERAAAGRHHPDGPRRVPRLARALPGHARHARQLHRRHRDAEGRPARRARRALRRPRHRQARRVRAGRHRDPRGHRSRPRSGRTAWSRCRSSATART